MALLFILGVLLILAGVAGVITNLTIPSWRPRGPRRGAAIARLVVFVALIVVGVTVVLLVAAGRVSISG